MKTPYLETVEKCIQAPFYPDRTGKGRHREFGGAGFENLNVRFQLFLHLDLRSKPVLPD